MIILPSIHGYIFDFEDKEEKDRNNKPIKHQVFNSDKKELEEQRTQFINEGYKCSNILECII